MRCSAFADSGVIIRVEEICLCLAKFLLLLFFLSKVSRLRSHGGAISFHGVFEGLTSCGLLNLLLFTLYPKPMVQFYHTHILQLRLACFDIVTQREVSCHARRQCPLIFVLFLM